MKRAAWCLTLWAITLPGGVQAASKTVQLTVIGGKEDRSNQPVCVQLAVPKELAGAQWVGIVGADETSLAGQLTAPGLLAKTAATSAGQVASELHFILPRLKAGQSLTLKASISTDAPSWPSSFRWRDTKGEHMDLRLDDQPVLRYMYKAIDDSDPKARELTYKPYHHLFDPTGKRLVTKGPGGQYTHHRGLYYGFNKITYGDGKKADTWHCTKGTHESHEGVRASEAGPVLGRHRVAIDWHGEDKQVFGEEREMTVYNVPGGILVEFASRLKSTSGKVKLDGDPQHAGFQFRADDEVSRNGKKETYFLRPDGPGKRGETRPTGRATKISSTCPGTP